MQKQTLKIHFTDMWGHGEYQFNPLDNYFTDLLSIRFNIELDSVDPDVLIYSCFGNQHLNYSCFKIFFTGENIKSGIKGAVINPDETNCNLSFSKYPTSGNNYYLPLWVLFVNWFSKYQPRPLPSNPTYSISLCDLTNPPSLRSLPGFDQRKHMMFINNNIIKDRVLLFLKLQDKIDIDSYGSLFNNMGGPIRGSELAKHDKLKTYRTTIALENSISSGYITEKIIQPYAAGCIPVYRGGIDYSVFNPKSMILYDEYSSIDHLVDEIVSVCTDEEKWISYSSQPLFLSNRIPDHFKPDAIINWLSNYL